MVARSQRHQVQEGRPPADGEGITVVTNPSFTGNAVQGQTLTRVDPQYRSKQTVTIAYQWFRDRAAIAGATNSTYVVAAGDVGKRITLRTVLTSSKSARTLYSKPSAVVV